MHVRAYSSATHLHTVDPSVEGGLDFLELSHRKLCHVSCSLDVGDLQVGIEFSSKNVFLVAVKQYNIKHGVKFYVVKF